MFKALTFALISTLVLSGCDSDSSDASGTLDLSDLSSYHSDSEYADVLGLCASLILEEPRRECKIGALPPLVVDSSEIPTIDEIMDRVVVSHAWMGDNFRRALQLLPEETRILAKPLAAIVIDDDIRPSFFSQISGMIYLDPKYLWLTAEQYSTISDVEDFRNAYAPQMTTLPAWRYVINNEYAYPSNDSSSRTENQMVVSLARLLFHELAHANDFIEISRLPSLSQEAGFSALSNTEGGQMSYRVNATNPLQSSTLFSYAAALYKGESASNYIKALDGYQAGQEFVAEGANAAYGYTTRYEDFAMLVEETLMLKHYAIRRDTAFIQQDVTGQTNDGDDITAVNVYWGQRGRIGDPLVKPRAQQAMEEILPDANWESFFDTLAAPSSMAQGATWSDNLDLIANNDQPSSDATARSAVAGSTDFLSPHH